MKTQLPGWVEKSRVTKGPLASFPGIGPNGAFLLKLHKLDKPQVDLAIIASDGHGWDHVSVRVADNSGLPTWEDMQAVKDLFFHPHECAYQYHPKQADYVNYHPMVLHLWRTHRSWMPMPPTWMIGPKGSPWLTGEEE
jgi:hypothetical protein